MSVPRYPPLTNSVLRALPRRESQDLRGDCEQVSLTYGDILCEAGGRIRHVYFLNSGLVSLLIPVRGHLSVEVGMTGSEGLAGVTLILGMNVSPVRILVQGSGTAMRMTAAVFRKRIEHSPALRRSSNRYLYTLMVQAAQTAACNLFHPLAARLARWLLMTHDRMRADEFRLTQEFLAHMLGVRRSGVTVAASMLQENKFIHYSRGQITVLDRAGLERVACECYRAIDNTAG